MNIDTGHFILVITWFLTVVAIVAGTLGAIKRDTRLVLVARNAISLFALGGFVSLAMLAHKFVVHDYSNLYVWQHSSNDMPWYYLISAVWGGMDGSMLLWAAITGMFSFLALVAPQSIPPLLYAWVIPVLSFANCFFFTVVLFLTNPFRLTPGMRLPIDGNGLNPLLQNPSMMIHPPLLYLGFTGFVVPFAFSLAALLSGDLGYKWIALTRNWTLLAWGFLTTGIILGGHWAYIELGWGGFWAWDPVENASFMPWLIGTAFLHSVMVQQHRGMLKVWNVCLACLTYGLTVFGTFITRSGIVQSVHAFAETDVGWVFLAYLGVLVVFTGVLLIYRRRELAPDTVLQSYISREAIFLFNNLFLLAICFVTLWGVLLPVISEALGQEKIVVGPPFFNAVNNPLFLALIFLMGVGPMIAWRRASFGQIKKIFLLPFLLSCCLTGLLIVFDPTRILTAVSFGLSFFVITSILREFYKAARSRAIVSKAPIIVESKRMIRQRLRKYAAHLVHIGVALAAIGITASMSYKIERDIILKTGESHEVGSYRITLDKITEAKLEGYDVLRTSLSVFDKETNKFITNLHPEKRVYTRSGEVTTEVDTRSTFAEDLYVAFSGIEQLGDQSTPNNAEMRAVFKVFINPLQNWVWLSAVFIVFGSAVLCIEGFYIQLCELRAAKASLSTAKEQVSTL